MKEFITDCIVKESANGLQKEVWQFALQPSTYRLSLDSYHCFVRKDKDQPFIIKYGWSRSPLAMNSIDFSAVPLGSGVFSAALESALGKLQIDKIDADPAEKEVAILEFKKHIKMV